MPKTLLLDSHLPENWTLAKLGEVCSSPQYGYTTSGSPRGDIKLLRTTDITSGRIEWDTVPFCKENPKEPGKYLLEDGDIVVSRAGSVGVSMLVTKPKRSVFASYLIRFKPSEGVVSRRFFYLFLKSPFYWNEITEKSLGIALANVNATKLKEIKIPIPPLSEQHRIVEKIDAIFSELDNGVEQLKTAQQQLHLYRQSLLNTIVTDKKLQTIGGVIETLDQGWSPKCLNEHSQYDHEWAVIKTTAVQHGRFVSIENKILPKYLQPREQHELQIGDILITRAGPRIRVGVCCMVKKTRPRLINCDKVYRIKVNAKIIKPEYLELTLNTPYYQREIEKMKTGISDSGLNLTQAQFLRIEIPIPSLEEQQRIVDKLESKLTLCDKLEETITESLQQANALRQSILKKAFEGKLVLQDPKDEPASVLLERIKEGRPLTEPRQRSAKKRNVI
jgi:type I restriction enzyme, S subunit